MANSLLSGSLDLLILAVLAEEEAHGYAVILRLREASGGTFDLPEGTVYPALHRLERDGLLTSHWDSSTGRRRRTYSLTDTGREALVQRRRAWRTFSRGIQAVLGPTSPQAASTA